MSTKTKKRPYTGSVMDSYAEIEHDMGVPLTQQSYFLIVVGEGWTTAIPEPDENICIRRSSPGVLLVWRTRCGAEDFIKNSPEWVKPEKLGDVVSIKEISRGYLHSVAARKWSHILLDPVSESDGNIPVSQDQLSRID